MVDVMRGGWRHRRAGSRSARRARRRRTPAAAGRARRRRCRGRRRSSTELGVEDGPVVRARRRGRGLRERTRRVDRHRTVRRDRAGAEPDRGAVAFADAAHAHDERRRSVAALLRMEDHGRVAERGRLDGVLVGERGAEQEASRRGELDIGSMRDVTMRGVLVEDAVEVAVAVGEAIVDARASRPRPRARSRPRIRSMTGPARESPGPTSSRPGTKNRAMTRARSGRSSIPVWVTIAGRRSWRRLRTSAPAASSRSAPAWTRRPG